MNYAGQRHIVIVDDDAINLKMLRRHLEKEGFSVEAFSDGLQALNHLRERRPDLVIADWEMPEMSGLELCRTVRNEPRLETLYFLLLTGNTDTADVVEGLAAGADDYIGKPYKRDELLARVRSGLRITDMQRKVAQRAEIEAQRDRLQKALDALQQVLSMVGHELRTPLAALRALSDFLLVDQERDSQQWNDFLQTINQEVIKMSGMVNNMLEVIRLSSGKGEFSWGEADLIPICEAALDQLEEKLDHDRVQVEWLPSGDTLCFEGDGEAVGRLLSHLLENAAAHTQEGTIRLTVDAIDLPGGPGLQFTVRDTGEGIPEHVLEKLGHAFSLNSGFFGADYIKGTGFGLAICRGIVAAHGGGISVSSEVGKGTTVKVHIRTDLPQPCTAKAEIQIVR